MPENWTTGLHVEKNPVKMVTLNVIVPNMPLRHNIAVLHDICQLIKLFFFYDISNYYTTTSEVYWVIKINTILSLSTLILIFNLYFYDILHTLIMYKDCLGIMKEQCKNSRLPHLLMIVLHEETLWSPAPQRMDDDDDDFYDISNYYLICSLLSPKNIYCPFSLHQWFLIWWLSTLYETGPLPLCTFSVMGLSMCSSIFSESSPVRSKSGIIKELFGFPNSVLTVRCSYTSSSWHGHTGHAYCICFVGKH